MTRPQPRRQGYPDLSFAASRPEPNAPSAPPKQRNLFAPAPAETYVPRMPSIEEERWTTVEDSTSLEVDHG